MKQARGRSLTSFSSQQIVHVEKNSNSLKMYLSTAPSLPCLCFYIFSCHVIKMMVEDCNLVITRYSMGQWSFHDQLSKAAANFSFLMKSTAPSHPHFQIHFLFFIHSCSTKTKQFSKINNPSSLSHPFIEGAHTQPLEI